MKTSDSSIVEALSRLAETFGRLVVQHMQLVRSELESEGRVFAERGRKAALVIAKAVPFILAGLVLASFGAAYLVGLVLEPLLGRAATPVALLAFGAAEAAIAGRWLMRHLPAMPQPSVKTEPAQVAGEEAPASTKDTPPGTQELPPLNTQLPTGRTSPMQPPTKAEASTAQESLYGAVGR